MKKCGLGWDGKGKGLLRSLPAFRPATMTSALWRVGQVFLRSSAEELWSSTFRDQKRDVQKEPTDERLTLRDEQYEPITTRSF